MSEKQKRVVRDKMAFMDYQAIGRYLLDPEKHKGLPLYHEILVDFVYEGDKLVSVNNAETPDIPQLALAPAGMLLAKSGDHVLTIRKGRRDYPLGPAEFVDAVDGSTLPITILRISYCKVKHIPHADVIIHGETDRIELLEGMRNFYPDLTRDDEVTIVRFEVRNEIS